MKYIIEGFSVLLMLMGNLFFCVGVLEMSSDVAAAKEYKAAVVAEVENSNFNPKVMEGCIHAAESQGYHLEILSCTYGENVGNQMAEICLTYDYKIPLVGITGQRTTRGIAR